MSREINPWKSFDLLRGSNLRPLAPSAECLTARPPELTKLACLANVAAYILVFVGIKVNQRTPIKPILDMVLLVFEQSLIAWNNRFSMFTRKRNSHNSKKSHDNKRNPAKGISGHHPAQPNWQVIKHFHKHLECIHFMVVLNGHIRYVALRKHSSVFILTTCIIK